MSISGVSSADCASHADMVRHDAPPPPPPKVDSDTASTPASAATSLSLLNTLA